MGVGFRARANVRPGNDDVDHVVSTPTIAPIRQVVSVPDTIDFNPSELISPRRSGAMVPRPPIMMPRLPKLAKPHIAYSMISRERGSSTSGPSFDRSTYAISSLSTVLIPIRLPAVTACGHGRPISQHTGAMA